MYFDYAIISFRMVGFLPSEFCRYQGEGELKTIVLCETSVVLSELPENVLFIAKDKATAADFVELFTLFDDSFKGIDANVVCCCLGTFDISHPEKRLEFNNKVNTYDFHVSRNKPHRYVLQTVTALVESISELSNIKKVISFDPLSRASTGFHNSAVFNISNRITKANEKHAHFITHKRYQRSVKRKRDKNSANYPLSSERFDENGVLLEEEKSVLAQLAVEATTSETDIVVGDAFFAKKF